MVLKQLKDGRKALMNVDVSDILVEIDEETRTRLQRVLVEMYQDISEVCSKYGITHFLTAGSALGAIRHKGFIPWDDDLDLAMTRDDFERFIPAYEKELSDRYVLNAPNYSAKPKARFAKIMKRGTIFKDISDTDDPETNGIFIDIMVFDNVPRNKFVRKVKGTYANALMFISTQVYLTQNNNTYFKELYSRAGKANYNTRIAIGKIFSFRSAEQWFNLVDKVAQYEKKTGLYGNVKGRHHYFGPYLEENEMFPPRMVDFEGIQAPVFHDVEAFLTRNFGDYMKIPPVEKRERHFIREIRF